MDLKNILRTLYALFGFAIINLAIISCNDNKISNQDCEDPFGRPDGYTQVNLVADTNGLFPTPKRIDPTLVNAWGIVATDDACGKLYIAANNQGKVVVYDTAGNQKEDPIVIPNRVVGAIGTPTGLALNKTKSFTIPGTNEVSILIIASEDGLISAWSGRQSTNGGSDTLFQSAIIVAGGKDVNAVYKGVAIASDGGSDFIYAANFKEQRIDVFDANFQVVTNKLFIDNSIPSDFGPFNIHEIDGLLYVTYAKRKAPDVIGNVDDVAGPGNGYINIFTTAGILVKRFASQGALNSPWGIIKTPKNFSPTFLSNSVLVANFGDGFINTFNSNGEFTGAIELNVSTAVDIQGIWGLVLLRGDKFSSKDKSLIYFTAGPDEEKHGLFGFLRSRFK